MTRKMLLALALVVVLSFVVGCHTIQGIGRDIEWVGQKGSEIVR
jgi:predicted small secreted protein